MKATVWLPVNGVEGPCSDISFSRFLGEGLVVTMHFSLVSGLPNRDLRLSFQNVFAMHWEDECPGFYPVPKNMDKCASPDWNKWVFPPQRVEGSEVLDEHRGIREVAGNQELAHFLLISMNALLHVIARDAVSVEWIPGIANAKGEA
jgi:hypothetical protein